MERKASKNKISQEKSKIVIVLNNNIMEMPKGVKVRFQPNEISTVITIKIIEIILSFTNNNNNNRKSNKWEIISNHLIIL
jgi:hypothetical protein